MVPNRYYDRHFECDAIKILPGEYYATTEQTLILTVLGSCVAVCLRDPKLKIGGMNHFLLPSDNAGHNPVSASARYGVYAMEILITQILKLGGDKRRLEAKVFGGGAVLQGMTTNIVGQRNAEFVVDFLKTEQIPILASDLLDIYPRKVYFFPETGEVKVRKLKSLHNATILDRESEYRLKLKRNAQATGDVELF
ncbi:chemoreceptor glutamine deamidase CheD [Paraglaciecola chathamensis]|uniref:chemoreceptor glutamine deamidase CheD n=1 Tax=Paraglaciecola chathamensis TaxID=368405 RepID=UPI0026F7EE43|nr:chemoreceptor glutamine deamidase CheD [Paraglaciecola chathamensis]MDO6558637.1 chemoreceptor glutamine deamidase CheD [Paraglaciecola chathamensis]